MGLLKISNENEFIPLPSLTKLDYFNVFLNNLLTKKLQVKYRIVANFWV